MEGGKRKGIMKKRQETFKRERNLGSCEKKEEQESCSMESKRKVEESREG